MEKSLNISYDTKDTYTLNNYLALKNTEKIKTMLEQANGNIRESLKRNKKATKTDTGE